MGDGVLDEASSSSSSSGGDVLTWSLWQVVDSILPTGGFAHSAGLEAAVQAGCVHDSPSLELFAFSSIHNAAALLLPFVYQAAIAGRTCTANPSPPSSLLHIWTPLDSYLHACLSNCVARSASAAQGAALLRAASSVFPEIPRLAELRSLARTHDRTLHTHHAPVFGFLCGLLGLDAMTAQRAFLFVTLRDLLSAATRLNIVGPLEAAQMQHRLAARSEPLLCTYANRPIHDAHQTAPIIDVVQGLHHHLFSRLFRS